MVKLAPSMLSADFSNLYEDIKKLNMQVPIGCT